ncbi:VOC family protein [Nocardia sp. NPDC057440]|uniref:VOC family protein n=1 Tax=Nocardia sp. NPDC057440 TaxID=3346134 RepID=UPI00367050E1
MGPLADAEVVAFVPSSDLTRSGKFFAEVLGLTIVEATLYAVVARGAGTTVRITLVNELAPQPFTVLGWVVPDIGRAVAELTEHGVVFLRYEGMPQDAAGVWASPGGDKVAWFADPDGNVLSLTEFAG